MGVEPGKEISLDPPVLFRYLGVLDFASLYQFVIQWMRSQGMIIQQKVYKDKPSNQDCREIEIGLIGSVAIDDYTVWNVTVDFKLLDARRHKEKGEYVYSGRLETKIGGDVIPDPHKIFNKSPFQKALGQIILFLRKKDKDEPMTKKRLRDQLIDLGNQCRKLLGMETVK